MADRYRVAITRLARQDPDETGSYMAGVRGLDAAEALLDRLTEHVATPAHFPHRGSVPKELQAVDRRDYSEILFGRYRIVYKVADDVVTVALIADGRRDMPTLLQSRLLGRDPSSP